MTPRTPITGEEVADVLERAADLIAKPGGWTQGRYKAAGEDCYCASGAIVVPLMNDPVLGHVAFAAEAFFGRYLRERNAIPDGKNPVPYWNDMEDRQQAEVVTALRSAATAARQQGEGK